MRPGLENFIETVQPHYQLAIWTAATAEYTSAILAGLPFSKFDCEFVWTRQDCDFSAAESGVTLPVKNVAKISASYPGHDIVIIDDKPELALVDVEKVISIRPFYGNKDDRELERVLTALLSMTD